MPNPETNGKRGVPASALLISLLALLIPVVGQIALPPEILGANEPLLWLVALIPAFLFAYHRGWWGAATTLAVGMATLSLTQATSTWLGHPVPDTLAGVVVAYVALSLAVGWLAERLHRDRAEVEDLAFTDLLTHLPNRRHARVFLENEFGAAERGRLLSVVLFDLDHFKLYNDRFGHQAGDEALEAFSEILSATTRRMNLSARFGGEEFLTVLAGSDVEGALVFAERVRATLRSLKLPRGSLTVSAGVAAYHPSMRSPDELLAAADHALYQAKREGRNRVRLFGRTLLEEAVAEAQVESRTDGNASDGSYPRAPEEMGHSRPPVTLLPHQVTGFGVGRRVLLVEDENAVRDLLDSYLTKEGFGVRASGDVDSAIRDLSTEYDVLITDLKLPGRWGMELVRATKARWPATQVVVITGVKDAQVTADAMSAGADRYLMKPFGMPELRAELQDALARRDRAVMDRTRRRVVTAEAKSRWNEAQSHVIKGIQSLVDAAEVRDPYILGHHQLVTSLAQKILLKMDPEGLLLSPPSLSMGTRFLDVGKIAVPDAILNKAGSLLPEETEQVRRHPEAGRLILESALDEEVALEVVTWHHERWDGEGYPNGLLGEAIPLSARIAAVADTLAALTTARPYREAFPWETAVQMILAEEGHFDPEVIRAFLEAVPDLKGIRFREGDGVPPES